MRSDVCFLQFIPSSVCDFQRLNNSWGKIISIKGSHALGIGCGIRFSSLSALLCLAAGWITSNLHLDSDILMMNYAPLFSSLPVAAAVQTAFCPNVSPLGLMQGSELIIKKYSFRLLSVSRASLTNEASYFPFLQLYASFVDIRTIVPEARTFNMEKHAS